MMLPEINYDGLARMLKSLAHPTRLAIVCGLLEHECCVSKMTDCLGLPQPTVSMHLKALKSEGIIDGTRRGNTVCYRVIDERAARVVRLLLSEGKESGNR